MAKRSTIVKNQKKLKLSAKHGPLRAILRKQLLDPNLGEEEKMAALKKLQKMPKNGNPIRSASRCFVTGRCRGVLTKFGLSRLKFREYALRGLLPGITKSSW